MDSLNTCTSKRDMIIQAAAAIFCQDGFAGASIDAVACKASVSRQTIYNQMGDKDKLFKAVVADLTERSSAHFFSLLDTFPDNPSNLEGELTDFSARLLMHMSHDKGSRWLMKLVQNEGGRYPELFEVWREYGPGRKRPAVAARFAELAHGGHLEIEDASLAARQYMALLTAEWKSEFQLGVIPNDEDCQVMAANAVKTFLRAFGRQA
jgi:AcrR family transcriptional regulator